MKSPAKSSPAIARGRRNAELAAIHVAKKALGLDEATYREFLFATTGHRSAAELDDAQRQTVIELMRSRGFKRTPAEEKRARRMVDNRQLAMIRGLWKKLRYAGALADASERHLSAFVKKQTGIERPMAFAGRGDKGDRRFEELARTRGRKDGASRMKWLVEKLPRDDRGVIDRFLVDHDFHGYDDLVELLRRRGLDIGVGALKGYARRLRMQRDEDRIARTTVAAAARLLRGSRRREIESS